MTALEQDWAEGHAHLARAYHWAASSGDRRDEYFSNSKTAALRALILEPDNSIAVFALAFVAHRWEWDWKTAELAYRLYYDLTPNYEWGSLFLWSAGQYDEAILTYEKAVSRNPNSLLLGEQFGDVYACGGRTESAVLQLRKVIENAPDFPNARLTLVEVYLRQGRYEEAIADLDEFETRWRPTSRSMGMRGYLYARTGRNQEARDLLVRHEEGYKDRMFDRLPLYVSLGEMENAIVALERAYRERHPGALHEVYACCGRTVRGSPGP